jgi:hypothetical protein
VYPGVGACLQADARQRELTPVPESDRNGSYLTCKARKGTRFRMAGDQEPILTRDCSRSFQFGPEACNLAGQSDSNCRVGSLTRACTKARKSSRESADRLKERRNLCTALLFASKPCESHEGEMG